MMHYDDDALFRYAEGTSPIAGEIEAHLACCDACNHELASHREIVTALTSNETWEPVQQPVVPRRFVTDVVAFAERVRIEDAEAEELCDRVLTGPPAWWSNRLRQASNSHTAGVVRQLLDRMRRLLESSPANALVVTSLAIEVASELDVVAYPCDFVIKLRAQALRDHAYVLSFMGRFPEAERTAERSKELFEQVPLPEFDLARLDLVRAAIYRHTDRGEQSVALSRGAAETFLRFGDRARYLNAKISEAGYMFALGQVREALAIWTSIEDDPALESVSRVRILNNVGAAYRQLDRLPEALTHFQRAIAEFELLGLRTERTRCRWNVGQVLVAAGRVGEALPILQQTWREFDELELVNDGSLVALEYAEALLMVGRGDEVPAICRDLIARFSRAGVASRAMNALSFLREAVALGQAKPSLVRHVYDFLRELPAEPARFYAAPPAGHLEE